MGNPGHARKRMSNEHVHLHYMQWTGIIYPYHERIDICSFDMIVRNNSIFPIEKCHNTIKSKSQQEGDRL